MRAFRILYRDFLFRVVDRELLSPHGTGDAHHLFTQIAAGLVLFSAMISLPASDADTMFSAPVRLFFAWRFEHFIIATTMLAIGVLAILSWGSMFPDRRDVLVLAPLPVPARTILLAKVAAVATALSLAVVAMHAIAGLVWPLALNRSRPPIEMPSLIRVAAQPPVRLQDLPRVLDADLAGARTRGWLAPASGGGLAIAMSQRGERRILTYGVARPDSIFQIGSITKTFTAFALARMVQDGRTRLDAPVRELLPDAGIPPAAAAGRDVTLLDLVTHHSGLPMMPPGIWPDWRHSPFAGYGATELVSWLRRRGLERPADAGYRYSNLGFGLLGHALATEARTDYATLIHEFVAGPLGLADTGVNLTPAQRARVVQGKDDEGQPVEMWRFDVLAGAGAMHSSPINLLEWLEINLHPAGPLAPAVESAQRPLRPSQGSESIGLAWQIEPSTSTVKHSGAVGGYTADVFFNRNDDLAVAVLANRGPGVDALASRVAEYIRARMDGRPPRSLDDIVIPPTGTVRSWLRTMLAYWVTMIAASAFVAGSLVGLQGVAIAVLSGRRFVRISPVLQCAAFAVLVGGYLRLPLGFVSDDLVAAQAAGPLGAPPSYWFLGLFQTLNGSSAMPALAARAWTSMLVAVALAGLGYGVSYVRMLRGIVETSDVTTAGARRYMSGGRGPTRALADFAIRTLFRSAQPRVLLAFYWGLGFALAVAFAKTPRMQGLAAGESGAWHEGSVPYLVASLLVMGASVLAARRAFTMPRELAANWVFRMLPLQNPRDYTSARRRAMLVVSVAPVTALSAVMFLWLWPWLPAVAHVLVLAIAGATLVEVVERDTRKIPFACSYLPGRSKGHIALVVFVMVIVPLVISAATLERDALQSGARYAVMLGVLGVMWAAARGRTIWAARSEHTPAFDAEPDDRVVTLELWDNRLTRDQRAGRISVL